MALIPCPECSGKVSDKAAFCPHCGCPTAALREPNQDDSSDPAMRAMRKGLVFPPFDPNGIVVAQDGSSPLRSIGQAVRTASPGATIFVRKGQYVESVRIDRPVTIVGVGDPVSVTLAATSAIAVDVDAAGAALAFHNLTIRGLPGNYAINLYRCNEVVATGCYFLGGTDGSANIGYEKRQSFIAMGCQFTGGKVGICMARGCKARIERCLLSGHEMGGIFAGDSRVDILDTVIRDSDFLVGVSDDGVASIRRCELTGARRKALMGPPDNFAVFD